MGNYLQIHCGIVETSSYVCRLDYTIQRVLNRQIIRVSLDDSKSCANGMEVPIIGPGRRRAMDLGGGVKGVEPNIVSSCAKPNVSTIYYVELRLRD